MATHKEILQAATVELSAAQKTYGQESPEVQAARLKLSEALRNANAKEDARGR